LRAIRWSLADPAMFLTQLRAILRAAAHGEIHLLIPMLAHVSEIRQALSLLDFARVELDNRGAVHGNVKLGAMIEVPAAALMARRLAEASDFLSIGTNDLTQYALAADRQQPGGFRAVAHHPAVLRLIARTIAAAHSAGILVDVCGEAAGDPELLPLLVALGVDELSVSPARIAQTRRYVRSLTIQRAKAALVDALAARTADEVGAVARAAVEGALLERLEEPGDGVERL
jgi:phosphotransferase system enzyme I (PtsI)